MRQDNPDFQANLRYIESKTLFRMKGRKKESKEEGEGGEGPDLTVKAGRWKRWSLGIPRDGSLLPIPCPHWVTGTARLQEGIHVSLTRRGLTDDSALRG